MRFRIVLWLLLSVGVLVGVVILWNQLSLKSLSIQYEHVNSVEIYKLKDADKQHATPVARVTYNGQVVKIPAGSYVLRYSAEKNYQSGVLPVTIDESKESIVIKPDYSVDYMNSLLSRERSAIITALSTEYPRITLYSVQPGKLYENGSWYGTTLFYAGPDSVNNDTLRVVLRHESGAWKVKTVPAISLSRYMYPNIPSEVLRDVNAMPTANLSSPDTGGGAHLR